MRIDDDDVIFSNGTASRILRPDYGYRTEQNKNEAQSGGSALNEPLGRPCGGYKADPPCLVFSINRLITGGEKGRCSEPGRTTFVQPGKTGIGGGWGIFRR
ncbi:MAG: hypothetical protein WC762_03205 [Methylobacter sp.]|jgi:hypothetical protein